MKNTLLIVALAFGIPLLLMKLLCNPPSAKNYECKQYSVECELEKDIVLITATNFDSTLLDVYGNPIAKNKGEEFNYYVFSPKVGVLAPVSVSTSKSCGAECVTYNYHPSPEQLCEYWGNNARPVPHDLSNLIPGLTQAIVLVSGANEIVQQDGLGKNAKILYAKSK